MILWCFSLFEILFIFNFLAVFFIAFFFFFLHELSLIVEHGGYCLWGSGLALRWLLLLQCIGLGTWASVVVAHGLSGCGLWALEHAGSITCGMWAQ